MSLVKLEMKLLSPLLLALAACGPTTPTGSTTPDPTGDPNAGDPNGQPVAAGPEGEGDPTAADPAAVPTADGGGGAPTAEMSELLATHNAMRAKHCAAPLAWSKELEAYAQKWANHLRDSNCAFDHSQGNSFGENLAGGSPGMLGGKGVTAMWYDEVSAYRFPDGGFGMDTGHFTQLVWRGTTQMGCAKATCANGGMDLYVCEYNPPGNMDGDYPDNVKPAGCR